MTREKAIINAVKLAKSKNEPMFVFYEGDGDYQVGNQFDADTFFNGAYPVATIESNGEVFDGNCTCY